MNKRQVKKLLKQNKIKVEKINLNEDDFIIFSYDRYSMTNDTIYRVCKYLKNKLGDNVVFIPNNISHITTIHKEKLIEKIQNS